MSILWRCKVTVNILEKSLNLEDVWNKVEFQY